jgi:hemolysin activation/secretion protein
LFVIFNLSGIKEVLSYFILKNIRSVALCILCFLPAVAHAGFLEMPDTVEVPEFERESLSLDMDIPALRDRDPNPEAGPRLNVKEFRVQGLIEYPELGITRAKIIKQVEEIRFDMMDEGEQLESGYTIDELKEVSDLIAEIEKETDGRHVGTVEVQKLVFLIREQRRNRGVTLGMIEVVADTITRYYRERGFILAKAYIPKQHVRDGVVTITLMLGQLGEVEVKNNKRYSDKLIKRVFNDSLTKPVTNELIEEKLYLINDLPGLAASGYFEAGSQVGDTKLNVNVNSEEKYNSNIRLDNHGSASTGEYRAYTDFYVHNPFGIGDQLQLGVLGSFNPENSLYGSLRYSLPIYTPRFGFSVGASSNDFVSATPGESSSNDFEITGRSFVVDGMFTYKLNRTRKKNSSVLLGFSDIKSEIQYGDLVGAGTEEVVRRIDLTYQFDVLNENKRILHQGGITLTASNFVEGAEEGQDESPGIFSFDYSRLSFVKFPFIENDSKWILRGSGQFSDSSLSEVLQFGLAGPTRARGFTVNEFYADDAIFIGSDLVFAGPSLGGYTMAGEKFEDVIQPFVFLDVGYGRNNAYIEADDDVKTYLVDAGVGIKIVFSGGLRGNLSLAMPVDAENSALEAQKKQDQEDGMYQEFDEDDYIPGDGLKLYFDLQYGF